MSSDWAMVIITLVYTVTTIGLFICEHISINTAKRQLKETKKQFEESVKQYEETKGRYETTERIKIMPYLVLDKVKTGDRQNMMTFTLSIKNCGYGSAVDLYIFTEAFDSRAC